MEIYVDNAATTKMSETAIAAMLPYLKQHYGNPSSLHTPGQEAALAIDEARDKIASVLGASPNEIIFTSGGSEANNQALISAAKLGAKNGKKHIISTAFEHHSVLNCLKKLEKDGFEITLLPIMPDGILKPEQVEKAIRPDSCFVSVMYANNEIGTIQPIEQIGKICRQKSVLFHTDAVQAAGHLAIDVKAQNIDLLSLSAHKFGGPKGIGALYANRKIKLCPLIEGGAQESGRRGGTENVPAIVAMAAALTEAAQRKAAINAKLTTFRDELISGLYKIPHAALNGDPKKRLAGNVNFCFEGIEGESLLLLLDSKGIYASAGSACTSGALEPSHVLLAIGRPHEIAQGSLRISLGPENSQADIDYMLKTITEAVSYLREISPVWQDLKDGKKSFML